MTDRSQFHDHLLDLLSPLGDGLSLRRLFGGASLCRDDIPFALIIDDRLYFRVDEENRGDFERAGMGPFTYSKRTGPVAVKSYFEMPEELLEDGDALLEWARRAIEASRRSPLKSRKKGRKGR